MKVTLPTSDKDITLDQFIKTKEITSRENLTELEKEKRVFLLFTGLKYKQLKNIPVTQYNEVIDIIKNGISNKAEHQKTFVFKGVKYGMIPNFDKITGGEFLDLSEYENDDENLHKLMAVLYREVDKEDAFGNYSIKPYNGTEERAELFKELPWNIVSGTLFFFESLANQLEIYTLKSLQAERPKEA